MLTLPLGFNKIKRIRTLRSDPKTKHSQLDKKIIQSNQRTRRSHMKKCALFTLCILIRSPRGLGVSVEISKWCCSKEPTFPGPGMRTRGVQMRRQCEMGTFRECKAALVREKEAKDNLNAKAHSLTPAPFF